MAPETIEELHASHEGKLIDKWELYLREYQRLLAGRRDDALSLLEIGVQNGGSLELWAKLFPDAKQIVGCDIDPACAALAFADARVHVVVGDANTDDTEQAISMHAESFDVIIDDGSHTSGDIIRSFARYFPRLKHGGIYLVEDLHCSYWKDFDGGLHDPTSSMAFLKHLADVVNHEHWGVPRARTDAVKFITEHFGVKIDETALGEVRCVEFINSLCAIRKASVEDNLLGRRMISGTEALVSPFTLEARGMSRLEAPDQTENPWAIAQAPEEELLVHNADITKLREDAAQGVASIAGLQREIALLMDKVEAMEKTATQLTAVVAEREAHGLKHEQETAAFRGALTERDRQLISTNNVLRELALRAATSERERANANRQMDQARSQAKRAERSLATARHNLAQIQSSASWKLTGPLRLAAGLARLPGPESFVGRALAKALSPVTPRGGFGRASRRVRKVIREKGFAGATARLFDLVTGRAKLQPFPTQKNRGAVGTHRPAAAGHDRQDYGAWLSAYDLMTDSRRAALAARAEHFAWKPLISVLMPTYNTNPRWLASAIDSVRAQVYPHWELCIADDCSTNPSVREVLERYQALDPRIKICFRPKNGHISAATNSALELAAGAWTVLLDHDDVLTEHALFWVVDALNKVEGVRMIYSDEDKISETGVRKEPYFKSDWNEDLFRSHNMFSHLGAYETALLREVDGFRVGFEGSQDYDLVWRCLERVPRSKIHHIPRVLYSWRTHAESTAQSIDSKPYAVTAGQRAMAEHFERTGVDAEVDLDLGGYRVRYNLPTSPPLVSIVIPTRNGLSLTRQCIESIFALTTYDNYEILLIDNGSDDPEALSYFAELAKNKRVRVQRDERPFNYSSLNNEAVNIAKGELICLLNNDIEVITPEWLSEMVSVVLQPGVGAVGARLWFPNNTLQHGGILLGIHGVANHAHKHIPRSNNGYFGRAILRQSMSCVSAACLIVKKSAYLEVGGLDETNLRVGYNDVDFCLRLIEAGYRNVWTPYAELYHHESATRGDDTSSDKAKRLEAEALYIRARWADFIARDPAYNPNLSLNHVDFSYAWPPRVEP